MSEITDGLILHIPLTEALGSGPIDRSPARHLVHVDGTPRLHGDKHLGAAHRFNGAESLEVPPFGISNEEFAFTIQLWLMPDSDGTCNLFAFGDFEGGGGVGGMVSNDGSLHLIAVEPAGAMQEIATFPAALTRGSWAHLTIHSDGRALHTWINGVRLDESVPRPNFALESTGLLVGGRNGGRYPRFTGSLAHIRIYNRGLSADEIQMQYHADLSLRAAYVESHPIRLSLLDENDASVMYISDHADGEPLTLELFNLAGRPLYLEPLAGSPSPTNYHFELRFRPGTLHRSAISPFDHPLRLLDESDWAMSGPILNANGTISFFLLHSRTDDGPFVLAAERAERIRLTNVRADPAGGVRSARVELSYNNLHLGGAASWRAAAMPPHLLHGSAITQFSILSHMGRKHLPIHSCFIDGNTIIPGADIRDNRITLRLTNIDQNLPIPWQSGADPELPGVSYFEIAFDYALDDEDKPWALCRVDEALNVQVDDEIDQNGESWRIKTILEAEAPKWRIYSTTARHLGAGEYVEFTLRGLVTTLPNGSCNLYLRYANIPNYQAGQIIMTVEKSPLVVRQDRIGIGTNSPQTAMHIDHLLGQDGLTVGDAVQFVKVLQDMIQLEAHNSQAFFLPESLVLRDPLEVNRRTDLSSAGLRVFDNEKQVELLAGEMTMGHVEIRQHSIVLDDGVGRTILHPQSVTVRDSEQVEPSSSLVAEGLSVGNVTIGHTHIKLEDGDASTILHPQSLTFRDRDTKSPRAQYPPS